MIGIAIKKEKVIPPTKRKSYWKNEFKNGYVFLFRLDIAGLTNPNISFTIIGIEQVILNRIDTYI